MLFQIKSNSEDFIVEEVLGKGVPSGKGDFLYVFFEKENLTTMDIIDVLTKNLHLRRDELGIAGLKDKAGITRQWISISKKSLYDIGGEEFFIQNLGKKVKVLAKSYGECGLKVASNIGNNFKIRLRARQEISEEIKKQVNNNVEKINERGFPNCFGMQRFGKGKKNFYDAKNRLQKLAGELKERRNLKELDMPYHLRFLLQAYPSMYFNEYVLNRWEKGLFLLQGDVLVDRFNSNGVRTAVYNSQKIYEFDYNGLKRKNSDSNFFEPSISDKSGEFDMSKWFPTGIMLGRNLLLPLHGTKARIRDDQLIELAEFDEWMQQVCRIYNLRGIRRVLFVKVSELKFEWDNDDIKLEFFLPTGCYATTLVSFILQGIDYLTLKDNSLLIPRILEN